MTAYEGHGILGFEHSREIPESQSAVKPPQPSPPDLLIREMEAVWGRSPVSWPGFC